MDSTSLGNSIVQTSMSGTIHSSEASEIVSASTASKVRTFLYEIAEGTTNYRSLHSLTQQVEHQYHGRFLVELIQNAHDALLPEPGVDRGRIAIVFVDDDGPFGTLYVANDGRPVTPSNFFSMSQLGQSDKDPEKSIGNKGIGFRSVLEITTSPQIFSRPAYGAPYLDGMCFGFSPRVLQSLAGPIEELAHTGVSPNSPFGPVPLVDWDLKLIEKFRKSIGVKGADWLKNELAYLSPYLLPTPLTRDRECGHGHEILTALEKDGFATVVRLELKSEAARTAVKEKIRQLPSDTMLFLDRASSLILDCGSIQRRLTRSVVRNDTSRFGRQAVCISNGDESAAERYLVWERAIPVREASEDFRKALAGLPGKWPDLQEARISVAVRTEPTATTGLFSVFLPTLLMTGCAAHVNAPFFADMSRTDIGFEERGYNEGLLRATWNFAIEIARDELAAGDLTDACALIDLLAPTGIAPAALRWRAGILTGLASEGLALSDQPWVMADDGWNTLSLVSLLPQVPGASLLTEETLRANATFHIFDRRLNARAAQLTLLAEMAGLQVGPPIDELAETIEAIAVSLHADGEVDWNAFWRETAKLLNGDASPLTRRRVLIGNDGQLHAADDECAVFFIPRRGAGEDDEVLSESAIVEIPLRLRPHVAFLHPSISLYDPQNLRQQTETRKFLEKVLVNRFRVEDIFTEVLFKRTPLLPAKLKGDDSELCADILQWGLSLLSNLAGRVLGDKTLRLLKDLALPCRGGWFTASATSYGPGWSSSLGSVLQKYLAGAKTVDSREAARRLLLPPGHVLWRDAGGRATGLLDGAGVVSGLRLDRFEPTQWKSTFSGSPGAFELPVSAPPRYSEQTWTGYRKWARAQAKVPHVGTYAYQLQTLYAFAGMADAGRFDESTMSALMELLLGSMGRWPNGWDTTECRKLGGNAGAVTLKSPLWYALYLLPWICVRSRDEATWHIPSKRWHIPAKVLGTRAWQFEHLNPLPLSIAHMLDQNPFLAAAMAGLGMPQYDPETKSANTNLLDALAVAAETSEIRDANVFLGQVRSAWTCFTPHPGQKYPAKLLVSRGGRRLETVAPSASSLVYVPDSGRSTLAALDQFDLSVLAIDASDARRLASGLVAGYPGGVVQTSTLRLLPVVDAGEWRAGAAPRLQESSLQWLAPVVLTLAAYFGMNPRGTGSARFGAQMQLLREARIAWCGTLSVALFSGEEKVAEPTTSAMWLAESKTLVATNGCGSDPRLLSEAIGNILEREDLEVPLKFLLREIGPDTPHEGVVRALNDLKLSEAQLLDVQEQWNGNLRHVVDLLSPLVFLMHSPKKATALLDVQNEDQLLAALRSSRAPTLDAEELVRLAREHPDPFEFGLQCHIRFGDPAALDRWNRAITIMGGTPLVNRQAETEFTAHVSQSKQLLRSLLAFLFNAARGNSSFREVLKRLDSVGMPAAFADSLWKVRFTDALTAFVSLLQSVGATESHLLLLSGCESGAAMLERLSAAGVDVLHDPVLLARDNRAHLAQAVGRFQQIGLAWALIHDQNATSAWEASAESLLVSLDSALSTDAYLRVWQELDILAILRTLPHAGQHPNFLQSVERAADLIELQQLLNVSAEAISGAAGQLRELKDDARRRSKLVQVCGREFDGSEDNLGALWAHICAGVSDAEIANQSTINLARPLKLGSVPPRRVGGGSGSPSQTPSTRPSRSLDVLVGMAGEIHAFRRLQAQYGLTVVTSSSWLSGSSVVVFPENASSANDGAGCDFRFSVGERTFHIEVKSSSGTDETFTLGSSEIRLAMELAKGKRRKQKERFLILRVLNATTQHPTFQVLPNPYDDRYHAMFEILEAGARVRYRLAGNS